MAERTITDNENGTCTLYISFEDEGIKNELDQFLTGTILVEGTVAQTSDYANIFEADLRRCNSKLFPVPEMPTEGTLSDEIGGAE